MNEEYIENLVLNLKESCAAMVKLTSVCYFRRQVRRWRGKKFVFIG